MKKLSKLATTTVLLLSNASMVFAQDGNNIIPLPEPRTPDTDLIAFVNRLINLAIGLAGLIAVGFLVYNGIRYILSSGDEGKVEKATKGITYAVIGLVICFISVLIVNFVLKTVLQVS